VFVVATGGSMDPYYMPRISEFITNLTLSLPIEDRQVRIGLITYASQPHLEIALGALTSPAEIISALATITYHGSQYVL